MKSRTGGSLTMFHRILAIALTSIACHALAQLTQVAKFDIPPQALETALRQVAAPRNLQILYTPEDVKSLSTPGLKGTYSAKEVVDKLIEGTGLVAVVSGPNAIVIKPNGGSSNTKGGSSQNPTLLAQAPSQGAGASDLQRTEPGERAATKGEKIEVTGSRIAHDFGPREVIRIQRSDIEHAGAGTVRDALRTIPQVTLSGEESSSSSFSGGTNVQLRGFPSGSTLTLLNGRRVTPSSVEGGNVFDLNSLLVAAIESVAVLAEAGSAAYGADAVAGGGNLQQAPQHEQNGVDSPP